jgi:hypothetical protein
MHQRDVQQVKHGLQAGRRQTGTAAQHSTAHACKSNTSAEHMRDRAHVNTASGRCT